MKQPSPIDDYINGHPRETLQIIFIVICLIWQSEIVIVGLLLYLSLSHYLKIKWWVLVGLGTLLAMEIVWYFNTDVKNFLREGFSCNFQLWKQLAAGDISQLLYYFHEELKYVFGFSLLFVGIFSTIDLIPLNPHQMTLKNLSKGKHNNTLKEISDQTVDQLLRDLKDENVNGTLLGISKQTGKPIVIPDKDINQILLVLGTTGSGKTITLRRFYQRAIRKNYPLIIIDGKPSLENITWLMTLAEQYQRSFYGFNCGNYYHYDPLAYGGFTELKDKIISLKDQWENDYYRSIAEDYLQTTFEVLLKSKASFNLKRVVECLDYDELVLLARSTHDEQLMHRVASLENYERKDITGLQAHLNILIHSELGEYFQQNEKTFNLADAIKQGGVVYFALPALRFPHFAKVLGKLVINDLKAVIDRLNSNTPLFAVFDEFSVFAGDQALNLVNMGREKGVHAIFGTQGLADLRKVDSVFLNQILNCANSMICHRLNDQESAETIANWVGTQDAFTVTAQISSAQGATGLGTVKSNKEFIIHPDWIKQSLKTGEAFYVTKIKKFAHHKVKMVYSAEGERGY